MRKIVHIVFVISISLFFISACKSNGIVKRQNSCDEGLFDKYIQYRKDLSSNKDTSYFLIKIIYLAKKRILIVKKYV